MDGGGHRRGMTSTELEAPDDAELWSDALAGNGEAFGALFDRHAKRVYNHCFRLTASWSVAEDLLQNTFLLAWRKRNKVHVAPGDSALPWLLTVATNAARTERRSFARRMRLVDKVPPEGHTHDPADDVAAKVDDERRMAELLDIVRKLPRGQQEALALCVWADLSYAEAADALGIKEASVRARVSRAKTALGGLASTTNLVPIVMKEEL